MSSETGEDADTVLTIDQAATPDERKKQARQMKLQGLAKLAPLPTHLEEFYTEIPVTSSDGTIWQCPTKIVRPKLGHDPAKTRPLIVYFYGGGFMVGDPDLVTSPAREWAEAFNATLILPSYRLVPDVRYPVPMTDATSVIQTIASGWAPNGERPFFGADTSDGFILGGSSAGAVVAGIAAGLSFFEPDPQLKVKLQARLTGIFLCNTWIFRTETVPDKYKSQWTAMEENAYVRGFTSADMHAVYESLQVSDSKSPLITPAAYFLDGKRPESGIWPRTYFQACQYDPLRDDSVVFEKMLAELGTETRIRVFPDDVHASMSVLPFVHKSRGPSIEQDTIDGMAWLLRRTG